METQDVRRVELAELSPDRRGQGLPLLKQDDLIRDVKVKALAFLGHVEVTVGRLFDLKEGEVLQLDTTVDEPVELRIEGKPVARGEIVVVGDQFGIRITEIAPR